MSDDRMGRGWRIVGLVMVAVGCIWTGANAVLLYQQYQHDHPAMQVSGSSPTLTRCHRLDDGRVVCLPSVEQGWFDATWGMMDREIPEYWIFKDGGHRYTTRDLMGRRV